MPSLCKFQVAETQFHRRLALSAPRPGRLYPRPRAGSAGPVWCSVGRDTGAGAAKKVLVRGHASESYDSDSETRYPAAISGGAGAGLLVTVSPAQRLTFFRWALRGPSARIRVIRVTVFATATEGSGLPCESKWCGHVAQSRERDTWCVVTWRGQVERSRGA